MCLRPANVQDDRTIFQKRRNDYHSQKNHSLQLLHRLFKKLLHPRRWMIISLEHHLSIARGQLVRKRDWEGDDLNFQQILIGLFPFPAQSSQSQSELCVTPLFYYTFSAT